MVAQQGFLSEAERAAEYAHYVRHGHFTDGTRIYCATTGRLLSRRERTGVSRALLESRLAQVAA